MHLLDTNHCSRIILNDPAIAFQIEQKDSRNFATSIITRGELMYMAYHSAQVSANLSRVHDFLEDINLFLIDEQTADIYGELKAALMDRFGPKEKSKRRRIKIEHLGINENDLWIAAIAVRNNLTIVSGDSDFKRIQEVNAVNVENWVSLS